MATHQRRALRVKTEVQLEDGEGEWDGSASSHVGPLAWLVAALVFRQGDAQLVGLQSLMYAWLGPECASGIAEATRGQKQPRRCYSLCSVEEASPLFLLTLTESRPRHRYTHTIIHALGVL